MMDAAIHDYENGTFKLESIKSYLDDATYKRLKREERLNEILNKKKK